MYVKTIALLICMQIQVMFASFVIQVVRLAQELVPKNVLLVITAKVLNPDQFLPNKLSFSLF